MGEFDYPKEKTLQDAEIALWAEFQRGAKMPVEIVAETVRRDHHRPILQQNWPAYEAEDPTSRVNTRMCCYLAGIVAATLAQVAGRRCIDLEDMIKAAEIVKVRRGGARQPRQGRTAGLLC